MASWKSFTKTSGSVYAKKPPCECLERIKLSTHLENHSFRASARLKRCWPRLQVDKLKREHRMVVLPAFQGLGLGPRLGEVALALAHLLLLALGCPIGSCLNSFCTQYANYSWVGTISFCTQYSYYSVPRPG